MKRLLVGTLLLSLSACGSLMRNGDVSGIQEVSQGTPAEVGYKPSEKYKAIDLEINPSVEKWIHYFTGRGRKYMQTYLQRSSRYIPMMKGVFRERGMPDELAYIAMIESGFSATAFSHASAVGYWQFIRGTGKRYDLKIDAYVDERRDPILSTQAAANYLDSLYNLFGDWSLAMSGYNAGENRIQRAIMRAHTRDFWELAKHRSRRVLPVETRNYVPKFIAAVHIAKNPALYGFVDIDFHPEFEFESVVIEKPLSLEKLATELNVPYEELKRMNPRYKSDFVPLYDDRTNAVRVPVGMKDQAIASLEKAHSDQPLRYVEAFEFYRVRRGDTLSEIAAKFRTSIAYIRELNNLHRRQSFIRVGQRLKVPDGPRQRTASRSRKQTQSQDRNPGSADGRYHVVRRGDTLIGIAQRYKVSIGQLRNWNGLGGRSMIRVGQKIRIAEPTSSYTRTKKRARKLVHVVRRGENLSEIAQKYNVTVAELAEQNSIRKKSLLYVGKKLVIRD